MVNNMILEELPPILAELPVKNWSFEDVENIELSPFIFSQEPRSDILHRVVTWQLAKRRAGTHKTKQVGDISGTTKKPWRQKGTGRARAGSLRSPQFRGGAVIFGPVVRGHGFGLQKKVRRLGLRMALSSKRQDGRLTILEDVMPPFEKTKDFLKFLANFSSPSVLFVTDLGDDGRLLKGVSNIPYVDSLKKEGMNVYDILNHDHLVLSRNVITYLEGRLT
jgi:large subunit ribosomal protein L4